MIVALFSYSSAVIKTSKMYRLISTLLLVSSIKLTYSQLGEELDKHAPRMINPVLITTLNGVPVLASKKPPPLPTTPRPPPTTIPRLPSPTSPLQLPKPYYPVPVYVPPPQNVPQQENYLKAPGLARLQSFYSEIGPNIDQDQGQHTYYTHGFETDNGIKVAERAFVPVQKQEGQKVVEGSYSWYSPEGQHISVSYVADENGYRPIVTYHKK